MRELKQVPALRRYMSWFQHQLAACRPVGASAALARTVKGLLIPHNRGSYSEFGLSEGG